MNARRAVRRLAKGAGIAFLAGALGGAALLAAEIVAARSRTYAKPDLGLTVRGSTGGKGGSPLRLILLGDAMALGVGVETAEQTLGGQLARMLGDAGARGIGLPRRRSICRRLMVQVTQGALQWFAKS